MLKSDIVAVLETELSLSHRRLLDEAKEELVRWSKKRFWIVSFLTFFGLAGVINLLLNVTVGHATRAANEAAVEAQFVASSASEAITRIEKSILDANDAASEANLKAILASESAEIAKSDAKKARIQANEAQEATNTANATIDILQSDRIRGISSTIIDLEERVDLLRKSADELHTLRVKLDPQVQKMSELTSELSSNLGSQSDKADALFVRTEEIGRFVAITNTTLSNLKGDMSNLKLKIENIDQLQSELNSRSLEIVDIVKSGSIYSAIVEYDRLNEEIGFPINAVVTDALIDITLGNLVGKGVHCSMRNMPGYQQLRNLFDDEDRAFFSEVVYENYLDLANGIKMRECNIILIMGEYARSVTNRILSGDQYSFLKPRVHDVTEIAFF